VSEVTGGRGIARTRRALPPLVVLALGLLTTAVCMILLFGPFYGPYPTPGQSVQFWLRVLSDGRGPYVLQDLLWNRFAPSVAVILIVILAVLPWFSARRAQAADEAGEAAAATSADSASQTAGSPRTAEGARRSRPVRGEEIIFSDDGRILARDQQDTGRLRISVEELREMARSAGLPWHTDFETAGGARGVLEILRAVHTGPVGVRRAEQPGGVAPSTPPVPEAPGDASPGTEPVVEEAGGVASRAEPLRDAGPALRGEGQTAEHAADGDHLSAPGWTPSYSGSVYTSTSLYSSERSAGGGSGSTGEGSAEAGAEAEGTRTAADDETGTDGGRS